ncbi:MAG: hypothetical protein JNK21_16140, partial [Rhodospirillaceae bacterium]|nr:hypothetical protein [Rhodospirillaceae bacterium]
MGATDFPFSGAETDKTGETATVGNDEFLRALFPGVNGEAAPVVTNFAGDPGKVSASAWQSQCWRDGENTLPPDANNYFSLASFRPDDAGVYRRRKSQFAALHAVMLDDIGGKVPIERLTLPPTWLLETSPGNHQAGYLLAEPLNDGPTADRLMNAIVAAELCDPGANGPRARLARLPVAVNGKHAPPFACRLVTWAPRKRYSLEQLADGLELDLAPVGRAKRQTSTAKQAHPDDGDAVWIPRPEENTVIAALRERGLYKAPLGDG